MIPGITKDSWERLLAGPDDEYYLYPSGDIDRATLTVKTTTFSGKIVSESFSFFIHDGSIFQYPTGIESHIDWSQIYC